MDATNYFVAQAGLPKDKLRYHDFGFTVGGPVVKDKLHFFVSEEWNRSLRGTLRSAFVPTAAEREGDFSGPPLEGCSPPVPVDPLTGEPFPGNRIPVERLSPGGRLLLQLYPLPNTTRSTKTSACRRSAPVTEPGARAIIFDRYSVRTELGTFGADDSVRTETRYGRTVSPKARR